MRFIMLVLVFAICDWSFFFLRRFSVSVCHQCRLITSNKTPVRDFRTMKRNVDFAYLSTQREKMTRNAVVNKQYLLLESFCIRKRQSYSARKRSVNSLHTQFKWNTTSASIVRGTRVFQLKKTWNGNYDRATKNTWQKPYVNGLQWTKNLRKWIFPPMNKNEVP